jgi:autotransporter translocation and assembly factor TamB
LRANATVQNGTASLVAGGGLLQDIDAQILADGDGPLKLVFRAAARSRQPNIKGTASVRFEGPHFKRLDTELELTSFPLLYDGILMGRATTPSGARKLAIVIDAQESGQVIDVFVPAVEVKLPESDDKKLIQLDDDPAVKVADAPRDPEAQLGAAGAGGRTTLKVRLGKSVVVKRGALEVPVGASLTLSPEGRFTGTVTFPPGGVVPAVGQVFRISRGSVTFKNQDVKDGKLAVEASTRVADGTLVELNVSGSVRAPEVRFRSDPPRSQGEIVAALLGIQTETNTNSKGGEQLGRTAMALAMNRLLEGSPLSTLQFGAGETSEGEAVSSVSMRVANKVWLEGRTVKGSNTSINPDERVSGVVDWRFAPSWSLRTQLGDISGVELRWSLRY